MPQKSSIFEVMGTPVRSDFYTYDSILPGSIRLLKIHSGNGEVCCSITAISLADAPQYGALSYTWGGPADDCFIRIDGLRYGVRKILLRCLKQIRNMDDFWSERNWTYIWIDAICVNQSDAEERTQQVGMFSGIYRGANEVIVWLGPSYGESGRALGALAAACRRAEGQGLRNIAERPYWTRLWVFQELVLAQKQTLLCGDLVFDWEDLSNLFDNLASHPPQRLRLQSFNFDAVIRSPARDMCTQVQSASGRSTLFEQISGTQHLRCSVIFDRVYALLGTAMPSNVGIMADYDLPLSILLNQVLRDIHFHQEPQSLYEVEQQCKEVATAFGLDEHDRQMFSLHGPASTIGHATSLQVDEFPFIDEDTGISLWWACNHAHTKVQELWENDQSEARKYARYYAVDMDVSRRIVKTPWAQEFLEFVLKGETAAAHVLLKGCQRIRNDKVLRVTALLGAIHEGREALVNILIDDELQVTTALQKASASGQCALLRAMLDYELCDEIDDESWNLHDALCGLIDVEHDTGNEYTAIMEPLVKHPNYDPNFKDRHARDSTVLNYASGKGKYPEGAVRLLLACKDIDVNMQDEDFMSRPGETALHYLSEHGSETMVQLLLAHTNIDINVQSSDGFTPLHPAVRASRDETILRTLLNAPGIDLRLTDDNDMTPLHWALCDQNAPAINMLLEKDPDCINDPRTESLLGLPFNWEVRTLEGNSAYFFNHETSRKAWTQELDNVIEIEPSNGEPDLSAYKDSGRLEIRTFAQRMAAQWLMRAYSDGTGLYQYYDIDGLLLFQHNERFDIRRFVSGANIETIARFLTAPIAVAEQPEG